MNKGATMMSDFATRTARLVALAGVLLGPSPLDPVGAVDHARLGAAVEAATQQLIQINAQLEQLPRLQQRARHLERFITLGNLLTAPATAPR
jgi:hypothetical protein